MVVVHTLKPSSLAHYLQIHYIGLTGLRFHASWAWPEKRDPTVSINIIDNFIIEMQSLSSTKRLVMINLSTTH